MEQTTKTNQQELSIEDKKKLKEKLESTCELLEVQARVEEARMKINKAKLESLVYLLKFDQLKNPPKNDDNQQPQPASATETANG